ncbi:DUF7144 family membrane protein [Streptomyces gilvosporeus]|uniref:DUF7144 domain-containing protein n=1 Tax=Streptomyces gilvosporeus TaxID=553510 RepID=A0A1V0U0Y0_9ACTN|nr:hypothetical protein [Streptomyces gilvosporeus]ARF58854.1 hypothetical protein B1H19_35895 [Streptomyces gilvosporeus]
MATHAGGAPVGNAPRTQSAAAEGWTVFAAVLMIFGGIMAIFEGVSAIAKDTVFVTTAHYVFQFNLTGWGVIHLVLGIVVALAGAALFTGAAWARIVGIVLAGLSMLANFIWLPHFPVWAIVVIAIDAFIIWALCHAHGVMEE